MSAGPVAAAARAARGARWPAVARAWATALLDLAYPPRCAACDEALGSTADEPFCPICAGAIEPVPDGCARCGMPGAGRVCGACALDPPPFETCHAAALLGGPMADAVHAFKYHDRPALARPLGAWMAGRVPIPSDALLIPVPLARSRRLARGYDQAALLARSLARAARADSRVAPGALARTRPTSSQVGRSRRERLVAVRGAFRATPLVRGCSVVLVDDVVTTGATVSACAEALIAAGARSVAVVALARAD